MYLLMYFGTSTNALVANKLVDEYYYGVVTLQTTSLETPSCMVHQDWRQNLPVFCIRLYKIARRVEAVGNLRQRQ